MTLIFFPEKAEIVNFSIMETGTFLRTFLSLYFALKFNFHFENPKKSSKLQMKFPTQKSS